MLTAMTPEAEELVRAARGALRPAKADRERVFRLLLPLVGLAQGAGLTYAATGAKVSLAKASAVLVAVGVASGGFFLAMRPESPAIGVALSALGKPTPVSQAAPRSVAPPAPEVGTAPQPERPRKSVSSARRPTGALAQEVSILSRAGAELHGGQAAAALKTLEEHQRNFPSGVLTEERLAARIRALCVLGRKTEAEAELARLARTSPNSPHEARARRACGSSVTPAD